MVIINETEARKRVRDNDEKILEAMKETQELELKSKEEIRERIRREDAEDEKKNAREVSQAVEKSFNQIGEVREEVNRKRKERENGVVEFGQKLEEANRETLKKMEEVHAKGIEKSESAIESQAKKLHEAKNKAVEGLSRLNEIKEEGMNARNIIQDQFDEEEKKVADAHGQKLLDLEKERNEVKIKHQNDLLQIAEADRKIQKEFADQLTLIEEERTQRAITVIDAMSEEKKFDKLRKECKSVFDLFIKSKTVFSEEEASIMSAITCMNRLLTLNSLPDVASINKAFTSVSNAIDQLEAPDRKYRELFSEVQEKIDDFKEQIFKIDISIKNYGKIESSMELPSDEQLRRDSADLEFFYKTAKRILKELSELMAQFKIPASQALQQAIGQMRSLTFGVNQLQIQQ
uniref:MICOS complex subunit MIC60 n=1 Tax=Caenorhabditis tropicalis TaxID=1561998 RepID=A0A1I7UGG9_9PELO